MGAVRCTVKNTSEEFEMSSTVKRMVPASQGERKTGAVWTTKPLKKPTICMVIVAKDIEFCFWWSRQIWGLGP